MADDIWKEMALLQPCLDFLLGGFFSFLSLDIYQLQGRPKKKRKPKTVVKMGIMGPL